MSMTVTEQSQILSQTRALSDPKPDLGQDWDIDKSNLSEKISQKASFYWRSNIADIMRHKCHFLTSTLSIFIVVLMALVVYSVIDKAPVIFLKLAEKNSGEMDAYFFPPLRTADASDIKKKMYKFTYYNYTKIQGLFPHTNFSPRYYFGVELYPQKNLLGPS